MADMFKFPFDADAMKEMFSTKPFDALMPKGTPMFDFDAMQAAQQKNVSAVIEANKVAFSGYQAVLTRQLALIDEAVAKGKDMMSDVQAQPMSAEGVAKNAEILKGAFEKSMTDVKELAEMGQKANTEAFEIIKTRLDEIAVEVKAAVEKAAA